MARAGSWKLVTVPPCVFEPVPLLSFFLRLGNSESWKVETAITLPVLNVCTFPATRKALATLRGPRRAQRLGQSARRCSARRGRLGIASEHARILAAPADARRIESRAALRRRRHLLSCDGHAAQPLPHDWICAAPARPAGTGESTGDLVVRHRRKLGKASPLPSPPGPISSRYATWNTCLTLTDVPDSPHCARNLLR